MWVFIEILIFFFLGGYALSVFYTLAGNSAVIVSVASIVYLFGSIFVILVIYMSYSTIKAQKTTEQSLLRSNTDLERRIDERTEVLKITEERMMRQDKLAAIGKLAGGISHELRNPLAAITNSVYFLSLKLPDAEEKVKKHVRMIQEQSEGASKIISDLLDFARTKPDEPTQTDMVALIRTVLEQLPANENVDIHTRFDPGLPQVLLDPRKVQQALQNIIVNAYQAMPAGGRLEISATRKANLIEIEFKDTGTGISIENLPRIFEPLFSTKTKGIGLGLVITKDIIERSGGSISVTSKEGSGTTFTIRLPVKDRKAVLATMTESFW